MSTFTNHSYGVMKHPDRSLLAGALRCLLLFVLLVAGGRSMAQLRSGHEDVLSKTLCGEPGILPYPNLLDVNEKALVSYTGTGELSHTIRNMVSLRVYEENMKYVLPDFTARVRVSIKYGSSATNLVTDPIVQDLRVSYTKGEGQKYDAVSYFHFENAAYVEVTVTEIDAPAIGSFDPRKVLLLKNEMFVTPYFELASNIAQPTINSSAQPDQLTVSWNWGGNVGSNYTQLEWAWVSGEDEDRYKVSGTIDKNIVFRNNSTRVDLPGDKTDYAIPLLYDGTGTLYYRMRPVNIKPDGNRSDGNWYYPSSPYSFTGHEPSLNWQSTTSFAEEGKQMSVIQYYDGSLRGRQTVTKDNTTNTTITAETLYDWQGRAAVQILPAPGMSQVIAYTRGLNLFNGADGVTAQPMTANPAQFFDLQPLVTPNTLNKSSGTANYYSDANALAAQGRNKFIPDAKGYAYSLTRYTPDGTGRILSQSGVGEAMKMGGGHETRYYYGTPAAEELDALFGTEAGDHTHYFKNMVRDGNGQMSVSYVDMSGRTVATALAGGSPQSLSPLDPSVYQSSFNSPVNRDLLSGNTNTVRNTSIESVTSLLVPDSALYTFTYALTPDKLNVASCKNAQPVCYDCLYDLEFSITDESGEHDPIVYKFSNVPVTPVNNCGAAPSFQPLAGTLLGSTSFSKGLAAGSYSIRKTLTVSQSSLEKYMDLYRKSLDSCFSEQSVIDSVYNVLKDRTNCGSPAIETCTSCLANIPNENIFVQNYLSAAGVITPTPQQTAEASAAYHQAVERCSYLCTDHPQTLEAIEQSMLEDMMPYTGQYAQPTAPTGTHTMYDLYDIFSTVTPAAQQPFYRWPLNPNGLNLLQRDYYYNDLNVVDPRMHGVSPYSYAHLDALSKADFERDFDRAWAASLLPHHPEFQKLQWAKQNLGESYVWGDNFNAITSFAGAATSGFINPVGSTPYPDVFYRLNTAQAGNMNTAVTSTMAPVTSGNMNYSMWQIAYGDVRCKSITDPVARQDCYRDAPAIPSSTGFSGFTTDENNQAWNVFKGLYLAARTDHMNDYIRTNTTTIPTDNLVEQRYILHFPDNNQQQAHQLQYQDNGGWNWYPTTPGAPANVPPSTGNIYASPCNSYILMWKGLLEQCTQLKNQPAVMQEILDGLLDVCQKGSDAAHPRGSSTVAPRYTTGPQSFEEVIRTVLAAHTIPLSTLCHPFVIDFPKPYDKAPVYYSDMAAQLDTCNCGRYAAIKADAQAHQVNTGNLISLNQFLQTNYGDTLTAVMYQGLQHCSELNQTICTTVWHETFYQCGESLPCVTTQPRYGRTVPDNLGRCSVFCPSDSCYKSDSIYVLPFPQHLPEFLKCGYAGNARCITCTDFRNYVNDFKTYFTFLNNQAPTFTGDALTAGQVAANVLFAKYVNYYTGFQYTWINYARAAATASCPLPPTGSGGTQTVICPSPEPLSDPSPFLQVDTPCARVRELAVMLGQQICHNRIDQMLASFKEQYMAKCLSAGSRESFTAAYTNSEYHYTLYYYDQAGNLVKTIPPKGAHPRFDDDWKALLINARATGQSLPAPHTMATEYRYNSLNQVIMQNTPDGGYSQFWYDRLGRLAVSQNAQQADDGKYSYTLYDFLGRIAEVGQKAQSTSMTQSISQDDQSLHDWIAGTGTREQVTNTFYDVAYGPGLAPRMTQEHLRNRVSYSCTRTAPSDDPMVFTTASFYSYDVHGNVSSLLQDYQGIADLQSTGNTFKLVDYDYDLISGKVNEVRYQAGKPDAFYHRYTYDAQNRLVSAQTSRDRLLWERDASYDYYKHGPLSRAVLGQLSVQGMDYAYTLQGWLKGMNSTSLQPALDMGGDGSALAPTARDVLGFSLHYYEEASQKDYLPIGGSDVFAHPVSGMNMLSLYNGNIGGITMNNGGLRKGPAAGTNALPLFYRYGYDQLNRLVSMQAYKGLDEDMNLWSSLSPADAYNEAVSYDPNGNILTYQRQGWKAGTAPSPMMDNLTYSYGSGRNQLTHVADAVSAAAYTEDIDDQGAGHNYSYDKIGNLTGDGNSLTEVAWTVYGKIASLKKDGALIHYTYDASGNRVAKITGTKGTYYVRDAQGNVLSVYERPVSGSLVQSEVDLYGSSRLGQRGLPSVADVDVPVADGYGSGKMSTFTRGEKLFELTNHLGNVLATVSDRRVMIVPGYNDQNTAGNGCAAGSAPNILIENVRGSETVYVARQQIDFEVGFESAAVDGFEAYIDDNLTVCTPAMAPLLVPSDAYFKPDVVSATDYYPGGMQMPGRTFNGSSYRYGFQNQEIDKEFWGGAVSFEYRVEDPRLVRFFSVDPLASQYPYNSPYAFGENRLIDGVELEGLEWAPTKDKQGEISGYKWEGYNADGSAKKGTVANATLVKDNYTYFYGSNAATNSGTLDIMSNDKKAVSHGWWSDKTPLYNYSINIKSARGYKGLHYTTFKVDVWGIEHRSSLLGGDRDEAVDYAKGVEFDKLLTIDIRGQADDEIFYRARKTLGLAPPSTSITAVYPETIFLPLPKIGLLGKIGARIGEIEIPVYRVFGGSSRVFGESWTFVNPKLFGRFYRNFAGLPNWNSGSFLVKGSVRLSEINSFRMALPLHGNIGRLAPELIIKGAENKVTLKALSVTKF